MNHGVDILAPPGGTLLKSSKGVREGRVLVSVFALKYPACVLFTSHPLPLLSPLSTTEACKRCHRHHPVFWLSCLSWSSAFESFLQSTSVLIERLLGQQYRPCVSIESFRPGVAGVDSQRYVRLLICLTECFDQWEHVRHCHL